MLLRSLAKRAFSSGQQGAASSYNILGSWTRLKAALRAPIKHWKRNMEPSAVNYQTMTNTTDEAFDEVAQEWQALVVGNPYDVNIMNSLEAVIQNNFGTVDNPHVVFTSEAPFRYVGCTGQPNEDDYEGHEFMVFMLREGPLQRCPGCGQVYKLVRLRNEFSPEMDYYISSFIPYDMQEMGDMDTTINQSVLRMQKDTVEYSQFETPSNYVYNLVNPDEHDRLLTDPAYRLERTRLLEEKLRVMAFSFREVEKEYEKNFGPVNRWPIAKTDYETLIDAELTIRRLDRIFERVYKFNARQFVDPANHARREKRMQQRKKLRWDSNYTVFVGGLTEEEAQYRDYFETDLKALPEDEVAEQQVDLDQLLASEEYKLEKYDFQERYLRGTFEEDAAGLAQRLAFKFKYRRAHDTAENFQRREARLLERQLKRSATSPVNSILAKYQAALAAGKKDDANVALQQYYEAIRGEAVQSYKDYFESEGEDNQVISSFAPDDVDHLVAVAENYARIPQDQKGYSLIPKRPWNNSLGVLSNFFLEVNEYSTLIQPRAKQLQIAANVQKLAYATKEELLESKAYPESIVQQIPSESKKIAGK